jgi:hypothetical protein
MFISLMRSLPGVGLSTVLLLALETSAARGEPPSTPQERSVEWTIESKKGYNDPFNDVDVDVVFGSQGRSWRVPTFWRGGLRWTVRFAPPSPGVYRYHLESTDKANPDLNGHEGAVTVTEYRGSNPLLKHGALRISQNKRYFEQADGTPFFWLGDTWWTGLSSRLPWEGFQRLVADRKRKGFTVVQLVAGLIPDEEVCPIDPGCKNEGGPVWDPDFTHINPTFFDYADRRIDELVRAGILPAIVGAWGTTLGQISVEKLEKHWRYIIARYGAYPVLWIAGGEVFDPPSSVAKNFGMLSELNKVPGGWTNVVQYIRTCDPYQHPVTVHELEIADPPLRQESLLDFRMFQPGHDGWPSIAFETLQLNQYYARTQIRKPLIVGEIGYERLGETHLEDFQRAAFWLAMLNGAAGRTYGAAGTWESYTADRPFQRAKLSFLTWEEGMNLPGGYQVGLSAKLLRQYPWWRFEPHPEWIYPRGTTALHPRGGVDEFHVNLDAVAQGTLDWGDYPESARKTKRKISFERPYAAGIPGEVRFVYLPYFAVHPMDPPTIFNLESGVRYKTYYWQPSLGIKVDLGTIERPSPGRTIFEDAFSVKALEWSDQYGRSARGDGKLAAKGHMLALAPTINESNVVVSVTGDSDADAELVLRYLNRSNYIVAAYSAKTSSLYVLERRNGLSGREMGRMKVSHPDASIRITAEVRGGNAVASLESGGEIATTAIVTVSNKGSGRVGVACNCVDMPQYFKHFQVHKSPILVADEHLERTLVDAEGRYRGTLRGPGGPGEIPPRSGDWSDYGRDKHILLNAYLPEVVPMSGDWLLVLDARDTSPVTH